MTDRVLDFHFDYISPYSYLAWKRLGEFAPEHGLRVVPKPTMLAARNLRPSSKDTKPLLIQTRIDTTTNDAFIPGQAPAPSGTAGCPLQVWRLL